MKGTIDHYLIEMDCLYEKGLLVGNGIGSDQFFEKVLAGDDNEMLYSPSQFKRTYGKVLWSPQKLSNVPVDDRDGVTKTISDLYGRVFEPGHIAHFFWTATSEHNMVSSERTYGGPDGIKMRYVFRIAANRIVAFSKDGELHMNGDYVLLDPIMEREEEIRTASGIWLAEKSKTMEMRGIVRRSNSGLEGKTVSYQPNADCKMDVLGQEYYAMRSCYMMSVLSEDDILPIDTHVFVVPDAPVLKYPNGLEIPECYREPSTEGVVERIGSNCEYLSVGDRIKWGGPAVDISHGDHKGVLIREGQVLIKFLGDHLALKAA